MKVGFILPPPMLKIAGGYKVVYQYANCLINYGVDVTIFYDSRHGDNSLHIPRKLMLCFRKIIAKKEPSWMPLNKTIKKIVLWDESSLKKYKIDILIVTSIDIAARFYSAYGNKCKIIHFIQDHENWFLPDDKVYNIYKMKCDKIVVSNWVAKIVERYTNSRIDVVKNGIDAEKFYCKHPYESRKKNTLAMMYSSSKRKNPQLALEVIEELKTKIQDLDVTLFSVEKRTNVIPSWVNYCYLADEEKVFDIYNSSKVYLCTSDFEGFGLPGLEAMSCGCVLISTDCVGVREYAKDGYDSFICPVGDKRLLINRILSVLLDETLGGELSRNAVNTARLFDLKKQQTKFKNIIINGVMNKRG